MINFLTMMHWVATGFAWGYLTGRSKGYRVGHADGIRRGKLIQGAVMTK